MSVEAKTKLIRSVKDSLSNILTVDLMEEMTQAISRALSSFTVEWTGNDFSGKDDMLEAYINALRIEGKSQKTLERYEYVIRRMLTDLNITTGEIGVYDIRTYLGKEKARGLSDSSIKGFREVYNAYFGWLLREGLIRQNPVANISTIKCQKKVKDTFSNVDIENMKRYCNNERDRAIVTFLLATGCRVSEVTGLNRENIDLAKQECKVLGKGNKERIVYLDDSACMMLTEYFDKRKDDHPALFISHLKKRLNPGGIRHMLRELEARSGVHHIHPHKFRRTLATKLIRRGMPIEEVAAILGHEKLDTTMEYVVLDKTDVKNAYRKHTI